MYLNGKTTVAVNVATGLDLTYNVFNFYLILIYDVSIHSLIATYLVIEQSLKPFGLHNA